MNESTSRDSADPPRPDKSGPLNRILGPVTGWIERRFPQHAPGVGAPRSATEDAAYWFQIFQSVVWAENRGEARGVTRMFWRMLQIISLVFSGFRQHQIILRASALTYETILSIVPLLAVVFVILRGFGIQETIARNLIQRITAADQSAEMVIDFIRRTEQFISNSQVRGLTGLGIAGLLLVSISMLRNVERAMNDIWGLEQGRSVGRMIADYISLMIIAPILLAIGAYLSTLLTIPRWFPFKEVLDHVVMGPLLAVLPMLTIWAVFIFIYSFMTNTRVNRFSAFIGGVIGGTCWFIAQAIYVKVTLLFFADRYAAIYASFAWVFILLVWINISWIILLTGAEITCAHMTLDLHLRARRTWHESPGERETLSLKLAALLAKPTLQPPGEPFNGYSVKELADFVGAPLRPVQESLSLFETAGLVTHVQTEEKRYFLCRSARDVTALDVLRIVRTGADTGRDQPLSPAFLRDAADRLVALLSTYSLKDLAEIPLEEISTLRI